MQRKVVIVKLLAVYNISTPIYMLAVIPSVEMSIEIIILRVQANVPFGEWYCQCSNE